MKATLRHDEMVLALSLAGGFPPLIVAILLSWVFLQDFTVCITLTVILVASWLGVGLAVRRRVSRPLQTIANLLAAATSEDFAVSAQERAVDDPLGLAYHELRLLAKTLRDQRLEALEAAALVRRVIEEIAVAVFAFDDEDRLRLVNRAGERLLGIDAGQAIGRHASELGMSTLLSGVSPRIIRRDFLDVGGKWELRRGPFRQGGRPHSLVVLSDVSRALREEERHAWQRLVRVLSHEINNSLAPIKTTAGNLKEMASEAQAPPDWSEQLEGGLELILARADSLAGFIKSYSNLARLPVPDREPLLVSECVHRVASLESRLSVEVQHDGDELEIWADRDQLDQLLINVLRNAVDAATETGGNVRVSWRRDGSFVVIAIEDEGPGIHDTDNLFVPFYSTKKGGSGIGLVLSQQIAEMHGGRLTLRNRQPGPGCVALVHLPINAAAPSNEQGVRGRRKALGT